MSSIGYLRELGDIFFLLTVMRENHHCCSVWLKIMVTFTLCKILVAGEHHLLEDTLSCLSGRNPCLISTPHIVYEEHSEEIDDEKFQDSSTDCDFNILEGQFRWLHAEWSSGRGRPCLTRLKKNGDRTSTSFTGKGRC